jgi:hypothetical protein
MKGENPITGSGYARNATCSWDSEDILWFSKFFQGLAERNTKNSITSFAEELDK